jgi:hypothetical protein
VRVIVVQHPHKGETESAIIVRYRVDYGNGPYVATINPELQPEKPDAPKDVEF